VLDRLEDRTMPSTASFAQLPLAFEVNRGQAPSQVDYYALGSGYTLALTAGDAKLDLTDAAGSTANLDLQLVGANRKATAVGLNELVTKTNYLNSSNPSQWITDVANYGKVEYENVYPGIDMIFSGNQGQLEYEFVLAPGANPSSIRMSVQGASGQSIDAQGDLVLHTALGNILEEAPTLYQQIGGATKPVSGHFVLEADGQVGFAVGSYNHSQPLVIDPTVSYATYMPYTVNAVAVDSAGDTYIAGNTWPIGTGTGGMVAELNPSGTALLYVTYLNSYQATAIAVSSAGDAYVAGVSLTPGQGFVSVLNSTGGQIYSMNIPGMESTCFGSNYTGQGGIAVDSSGNIYLAGEAGMGLETTANAYQPAWSGSSTAAFFAEINPNLSGSASLLFCTYLGGTGGDAGTGVAVDNSGNAYLTGYTDSTNFPTTAGAFQTQNAGGQDVFVTKIDPNLSGAASLIYSTYLGGSGTDGYNMTTIQSGTTGGSRYVMGTDGPTIAVNSSGYAYVTGDTYSANFPVTSGAYETNPGTLGSGYGGVAFVTEFNITGSGLVYSTYLGKSIQIVNGSLTDWPSITMGTGIAVDASGDAYVTGYTGSSSFPTVKAIQTKYGGYGDAFVTVFNPAGSSLLFSTYLGGSYGDIALGIALDSSNNIYVGGITMSTNFPVTKGAYDTTAAANNFNGFVTKIGAIVAPTFEITGSSTTTAGTSNTFTVTAVYPSGAVDTGYSGTIGFTSSDGAAILPADSTLTNGTGTFSVTLTTAGTQSITATDTVSGITGSDTGIAVTPAVASRIVITKQPTSITAGQTLGTVQANIEDAYGNIETDDSSDQVSLSVSSGPSTQIGGTTVMTVQAGIATFTNLALDTSGSYTLAAVVNLAGGGTLGPVVSSAIAVASPVSLSFGTITYSSKTGLYSETVTLTNTSGSTLTGPVALALTNLPSGVALTDASGTDGSDPYVEFLASGKTLKKNASVSITLTFTAASVSDITFGTEVVVGQ
jgi:hypothetical protein